jgi:hypothetical protein
VRSPSASRSHQPITSTDVQMASAANPDGLPSGDVRTLPSCPEADCALDWGSWAPEHQTGHIYTHLKSFKAGDILSGHKKIPVKFWRARDGRFPCPCGQRFGSEQLARQHFVTFKDNPQDHLDKEREAAVKVWVKDRPVWAFTTRK